MLLEHRVDTAPLEFSEEKMCREQRVAQQHIAGLQVIEQRPKQALLVATLALSRTCGRIDDGTTGQTKQREQPAQRKAQSRLLSVRLWKCLLIGWVSGSEMVVPSTSRIRRPCQFVVGGAVSTRRWPVNRNNDDTIASGSRCRARQKAPVAVLQADRPPATRRATKAFTAYWQDRSALNA